MRKEGVMLSLSRFALGVLVVTGAIAVSAVAEAQPRRDQRREVMQQHRIREGVRSGELTRGEARELRAQQRRIDRVQRRSKRDDGVVDGRERRRLERMQDRASGNIYEKKHNDETRPQ